MQCNSVFVLILSLSFSFVLSLNTSILSSLVQSSYSCFQLLSRAATRLKVGMGRNPAQGMYGQEPGSRYVWVGTRLKVWMGRNLAQGRYGQEPGSREEWAGTRLKSWWKFFKRAAVSMDQYIRQAVRSASNQLLPLNIYLYRKSNKSLFYFWLFLKVLKGRFCIIGKI